MEKIIDKNIRNVSDAFTKQSNIFDDIEKDNIILQLMRRKVREHVLSFLNPGNEILELNAGTGLDSVYFAERGFKITATDISDGMINKLRKKISINGPHDKISYQQLSFTDLSQLKNKKFDYIFSNFGGLNCIDDLQKVTVHFPSLLKPGAKVTLVIMPKFCPWEIALLFKGNFKTAFRRFKNGTVSNIGGKEFISYYHSPKKVINTLGKDFKKISLTGLNSLIPPPYMKNFPSYFPWTFNFLNNLDVKASKHFPFNRAADHFILTAKYESE